MNYLRIDKLSTKPLYRQLAESIEQAILKKELRDGQRLPSERDICRVFDVSSKVVRRAYDELAQKGFIEGITGKGTFVKHRMRIRARLQSFYYISDWLRSQGHEVRVNTSYIEMIDYNRSIITPIYSIPQSSYLQIRRIYKVNQSPLLSRILYIPQGLLQSSTPKIDTKLDCLQLVESLTKRKVVNIKGNVHTFGAYSNEALLLELTEQGSVIFFLSLLYDTEGELLAVMHSYFNAKLIEWSVSADDELLV
jgi:DNA-binding GntR family transcriptional regulator